MSMFCYQCQEASKNEGCKIQGVCGKTDEVANLQDTLTYVLKGISWWAEKGRAIGVNDDGVDLFVAKGLFVTVTNVNFDPKGISALISEAIKNRDKIEHIFKAAYKEKNGHDFKSDVPDAARWSAGDMESFLKKGIEAGVLSEKDEDIRSLKETLIYGIKGIAAYTHHAYVLNHSDNNILAFIERGLARTLEKDISKEDLVGLVLEAGKFAVGALKLLDDANTSRFGNPEITSVFTGTKKGPGILVSGHDLLDLEEILKQSEGKGINVYTHGEMLPANSYPRLKRYKHLVGNYGTSWYNQQKEFADFNGAIVMTTNCLQLPKDSYKNRLFTTGTAGWSGIKHIPDRGSGEKNFSEVIETAILLGGLEERAGKNITIGFGHNQILKVADKIIAAVKSGAIKRFYVMAGCDGRHKERTYFTDVANLIPKDSVILTAGCAKFRYNMLDLGDIGGIPRVIDAGQCNDSYSLAVTALKLKEIFNLNNINDLPISYDIAWYEQKAVTVLLALLHLGVKGIRLGPTLPAFLSKNVADILVKAFDIKPTTTPEADLRAMVEGR